MEINNQNIIKEFKKLPSDHLKWKWVIENPYDIELSIRLDNDSTYLEFPFSEDPNDPDEDTHWESFDYYIGWSDGIHFLLGAIGIKCESV